MHEACGLGVDEPDVPLGGVVSGPAADVPGGHGDVLSGPVIAKNTHHYLSGYAHNTNSPR
ncbi:hypothetical protein E2C01_007189 [Portunus trituberculatus]|uniref:Uncharacterized protein n=1 Tax=Portunus trituberculatus TaxID=210409 RepID=A0A5B7D090_PORTR|nr:hypothetical protein [Portunus trituberculatus]